MLKNTEEVRLNKQISEAKQKADNIEKKKIEKIDSMKVFK